MNIVPLYFSKMPPGVVFGWFAKKLFSMSLCLPTDVKKCAQQWLCAGPCQLWIVCNRAKKTNVFQSTTTSVPNLSKLYCLVMQIEGSYIEMRGHVINLQHHPHRITHANKFVSVRASRRTKRTGPSQRYDVADPVPHCARGGASLRSATMLPNLQPRNKH